MAIMRVGVDLAKQVFQLHGVDERGKGVLKRKLKRSEMVEFFQQLPPCMVAMEACGSAHHWARVLSAMGHSVKLIAPQFVKPYVRGNKNDANDAAAICEAASRPDMRFVPPKSAAQQDIQALHRVREQVAGQRVAKANQIRGLLAEYGIVVGLRIAVLRQQLPLILEDGENGLSGDFRQLLGELHEELVTLEDRLATLDERLERQARENPLMRRLMQLRGIGPVIASAIVGAIGDGREFKSGRGAAAWVGLVPAHSGTGGTVRLQGISKRGDSYLRRLLIHGARAVVAQAHRHHDRLSLWVMALKARRHANVAAVALANKTMRMAWALLSRECDYDPDYGLAAAEQG